MMGKVGLKGLRRVGITLLAAMGWMVFSSSLSLADEQPQTWQEYQQQRAHLERAAIAKRVAAAPELTPREAHADSILQILKSRYDGIDNSLFPPANPFHRVWQQYQNAPLEGILREMPKGCLLNADPYTSGSFDIVMKATYDDHVYLFTGANEVKDEEGVINGALGWFTGKAPEGWKRVVDLRRDAGNNQRYDAALLQLFTLGQEDFTRPDIRAEYGLNRKRLEPLFRYAPLFESHVIYLCDQLARRGVQYVEFRTGLRSRIERDGSSGDDEADLMRWFSVADTMAKYDPGFTLRIVVTATRTIPPEEAAARYARAIELSRKHPGMIVGFDMVGNEDSDKPLSVYAEALFNAQKEAGYKALPFMLQAGQTTRVDDDDVANALALGATRISHGLTLAHTPALVEEVAERGVCVESSPLLDQVLGYVNDVRMHPGVAMLNSGVPVVIAPGATGMIGARLADSWFAATLAWDLSLADIKGMILTSFQVSGMTDVEREKALENWQTRWDEFIAAFDRIGINR